MILFCNELIELTVTDRADELCEKLFKKKKRKVIYKPRNRRLIGYYSKSAYYAIVGSGLKLHGKDNK